MSNPTFGTFTLGPKSGAYNISDVSFSLTAPTSDSSGAFLFTSDNSAVAVVTTPITIQSFGLGTTNWVVPAGVTYVSALIVGGGGGGGRDNGGGGGGGGVIYNTNIAVTPGASMSIVVGSGGAAAVNTTSVGSNGGNSSFAGLVAIGGGGGGSINNNLGANGGSAGGRGANGASAAGTVTATPLQGNNGGGSNGGYGGGGGGGAGQVGVNGGSNNGGKGGDGISNSISGSIIYYAGGGGGGANGGTAGAGGQGGGGASVSFGSQTPTVGTNGLGGGGGGGGGADVSGPGARGGSGIVIISYIYYTATMSTSNLLARYDASVTSSYTLSGSNVTQWNDLTGNGYHLVTNGTGPTITTINAKTAFNFASSLGLVTSAVPKTKMVTVFIVIKYSSAISGYGNYIQHGNRDLDWSIRNTYGGTNNLVINTSFDNNSPGLRAENGLNYIFVARLNDASREIWRYSDSPTITTQILSTNNMNSITGGGSGGQYQSNLVVGFAANIAGWDEVGSSTAHIVDIANVYGSVTNTPNYVIMLWVDNVITQTTAVLNSNVTNTQYYVNFKAGPAVYQNSGQATAATVNDGIVFEILRANNTILATSTYLPGAWAGFPTLTASSFTYTGDGSGDVRVRIRTVSTSTGRFGGCVDDVVISSNDYYAIAAGNTNASGNTSFTNNIYVGKSEINEASQGIIGEILYYNTALSNTDVSANVGYLQSKWFGTSFSNSSSSYVTLISGGTANISATQAAYGNYVTKSVSSLLTVSTLPLPTIGTFTVASTKTIGDAAFSFTLLTSNSSGAITYSSSNPGVATIDASESLITLVGAGSVTFTATQAATAEYANVTRTSNTLTVNLVTSTLSASTFSVANTKMYGDAPFNVATFPTSNSAGAITYSSSNTAVATIDASGSLITLVGAGEATFTATQAATAQYASATKTSNTLTVALGTPTLSTSTFTVPATKLYGDASINARSFWNKLGADIDGEAAGDQSGTSVSMSADGTIVAIGAALNDGNGNNSGHVRVYGYNGSIWTKLGGDIDGKAIDDNSGITVRLSSDGTIVAIGAALGNVNNSGQVSVYKYNGTDWIKLGADIDGENANDNSGISISLSSDGTVVAIGAYNNDGSGNLIADSGHVRVYKYDVTKTTAITDQSNTNFGPIGWRRLGADIDGEGSVEYSGLEVSLSADGTIVAIGAHGNDGNSVEGGNNNQDKGSVRVYRYNLNKTTAQMNQALANFGPIGWERLGNDIDADYFSDYAGSNSLSADGTIIVIGANSNDGGTVGGTSDNRGHARIYKYNPNKTVAQPNEALSGFGPVGWDRLGADIDGEASGDLSGYAVDISSDGTIVAIGAYNNDGNYNNIVPNAFYLRTGGSNWRTFIPLLTADTTTNRLTWSPNAEFNDVNVAPGNEVAKQFSYFAGYWLNANRATTGQSFSVPAFAGQGSIGTFTFTATSSFPVTTYTGGLSGYTNPYTTYTLTPQSDGNTAGSSHSLVNSGHVRIYKYDGTGWIQIGDIDGEAAGDTTGYYGVSLSSDGSIVAIGSRYNNGVNGASSGHVRVYKINTTFPTSNSTGAITYTSNNTGVATINASGNLITFVSAGSVTFTATQAAVAGKFTSTTKTSNTLTVALLATSTFSASTFTVANTKMYGDAAFNVATLPTSNSSGAITYSSSNTGVATITASGSLITLVGVGETTFTATQAATGQYAGATNTSNTLIVAVATSTLSASTFSVSERKTYGDASFNVTTFPTSNSAGAITYSSSNTNVAIIDASTSLGKVIIYSGNNYTGSYLELDTGNYADNWLAPRGFNDNIGSIIIPQGFSVNVWSNNFSGTGATYTSNISITTVASISSLEITGSSLPICRITIVGAGSATFTATQAATAQYASATKTSNTLTVDLATSTLSTSTFSVANTKMYGDAPFNVATFPTSNSAGAITYSSSNTSVATIDASGSLITLVGVGEATFTATQAATAQYAGATKTSNTLTVDLGTPTLSASTFSVASTKTFGDAPFNVATFPTSNSTGAITYTSSNTAVATITSDASGNCITILSAGSVTFTATQAATSQYVSATKTSTTLTIYPQTPILSDTFSVATTKRYGDPTFGIITATTSNVSNGAITYSSVTLDTSNNALSFDGTNDYVATSVNITSLAKANFTIEAWVKTSGTRMGLVTCGDGDNTWESGEKAFYIDASGNPAFTGFGNGYIKSNLTVNDGVWHHIAVAWAYSGSGNTGTGTIYIDGVDRTNTETTNYSAVNANYGSFQFGLPNYASEEAINYFNGSMCELRIWNVVRTRLQIVDTMTSRNISASSTGLVAYYPMNVGTANGSNVSLTTLYDSTSNARNGTLTNFALSGTTSNYVAGPTQTGIVSIDASGSVITIYGVGNAAFVATQAAVSGQYTSATRISNTITVSRGTAPALTGIPTTLTGKTVGDAAFAVAAVSSASAGAITYTSTNTGVATVVSSTGMVTPVGSGITSIVASQAASTIYDAPSSDLSGSLSVKGMPVLTGMAATLAKNVTDASFVLQAASASSGAITYSSSNSLYATVITNTANNTGVVTLMGAGTVTITASQAAAALYTAATATCVITVSSAGTVLAGQTISSGTSFSGVDLSGASFAGSTLSGVSFSGAKLTGVNFSGAVIAGTNFTNANISGATNLPTFSTAQKLQLLLNVNNSGVGAAQINTVITGATLSAALASPITGTAGEDIAAATFIVRAPTSVDASDNKVISIGTTDVSNNTSIYIPLNANESVKINGSSYTYTGSAIVDASGVVKNYILISGVPFKVYSGSIIAVNIYEALALFKINGIDIITVCNDLLVAR